LIRFEGAVWNVRVEPESLREVGAAATTAERWGFSPHHVSGLTADFLHESRVTREESTWLYSLDLTHSNFWQYDRRIGRTL